MTTFEYKGYDHVGVVRRGLMEALDLKDAREKITALGVLPETVAAAGAPRAGRGDRRLNADVRAMLYRELGSLLKAGLPLAQALEVLIQAPELGEQRPVLAGIRDRIREGAGFSAALAEASRKVSPFERAVIEVGERSGTLEEILDRLASFMEEQVRMTEKVQTALIYPALVLAMALVIVTVLLGVMVPSLGRMLEESRIPLPFLTRMMMALGDWVLPALAPALVLIPVLVVLYRKQMSVREDLREKWARRMFRWPLMGAPYAALVNMRFARTLALLLKGGVPVVEGLALAGKATGNAWIQRLAMEQALAVRQGVNLSDAVRLMGPLGESLPGWMRAGEASGRLEGLLDNAADRYQQRWDRRVARLLSVLEPVLILVVGLFVLMIALSILLPVLQLNQSLK